MVALNPRRLEYTLTASHGTAYYFNTNITIPPTSVMAKINSPGTRLLCSDWAELGSAANRIGILYYFDDATGTLECYFHYFSQTHPWKLMLTWV